LKNAGQVVISTGDLLGFSVSLCVTLTFAIIVFEFLRGKIGNFYHLKK
jgi:hypothetical protein